ncbi:MAG: ABC transporter permease [Bacteroidales bacterium]
MSRIPFLNMDQFEEILHTLSKNKLRSFLTMFGVGWGIFMLIVMIGSGKGLERGVMQGMEGIPNNSGFLFTNRTTMPYKGFKQGRSWSLRQSDVDVLRKSVPELEVISPQVFGNGSNNNTVYKDKAGTFNPKGITEDYFKIEPLKILEGRQINRIDVLENRKVCIIGEKVYNDLFTNSPNTIGEYIKVNGIYYQVIGIMKPTTQISMNGSADEAIFIPLTTMQQAYNMGDVVHMISLTADPDTPMSLLEDKIGAVIREQHLVNPDDKAALWFLNIEKEFKQVHYLFLGISILIWIVGLGSLAAGVIGISNIMVVTIQERTKEIGIRRALGAKPIEIIMQIIQETALLTMVAGLTGLSIAVGVLDITDRIIEASGSNDIFFKNPQITFGTAVTAAVILMICGVLAGLIPAMRAMKIKAIDAIREE